VAAFDAMLEGLHPGRTERDLAIELERRFVDLGADGLAFTPIVASGPNGAIPHHHPTHRAIEAGDLVTFDIGARVDGYHADFTRTVAVGKPWHTWMEIHALVEAAQAAGMAAATAGRPHGRRRPGGTRHHHQRGAWRRLRARHRARRGAADPRGAHGVGRATGSLAASTVITVEPGVYLADHAARSLGTAPGGVRIEDTVLVTPNGPAQPLTDAPRALVVLPA
jgi:Xaa-Pro aminopeptidase